MSASTSGRAPVVGQRPVPAPQHLLNRTGWLNRQAPLRGPARPPRFSSDSGPPQLASGAPELVRPGNKAPGLLPWDVALAPGLHAFGSLDGGNGAERLVAEKGEVLLFAYGLSTSFQSMHKNSVKVRSRDGAVVRDPSVRVVFRHRGGMATLTKVQPEDPQPKFPPLCNRVHGVLYRIPEADLKRLVKHSQGYELIHNLEVETYEGKVAQAVAFASSPMALLPEEVAPTEAYMRELREGAAENWLHPLHQAWLSSVETVPSAGLPAQYYATPSKNYSYALLLVSAVMILGSSCLSM